MGKREKTPISRLISNGTQVYERRYEGLKKLLSVTNQNYEQFQIEHYRRNPNLFCDLLTNFINMSRTNFKMILELFQYEKSNTFPKLNKQRLVSFITFVI
jgi:hypothetical protein